MRKNNFTKHLLCLLFFLTIIIPAAQSNQYNFKQIGLTDGMPPTINCIYAEQKGFIWVGNKKGLIRFDGEELKAYTSRPNDDSSMPNDSILQIIEDDRQVTWILTSKGIARYSLTYDNFIVPQINNQPIVAYSACKTTDGVLFGGANKIYKYTYSDHSVTLLKDFKTERPFLIKAVQLWKSDQLLCLDWDKGILQMNLLTGEMSPFASNDKDNYVDIKVDSQQRIWLATYNNGIKCFSKEGIQTAHYTTENSNLNTNLVLCMIEFNGEIWLGTDGGGINILHPESGTITVLEQTPGNPHSLPANTILCLHSDSSDNVWAGTTREGLINIREISMRTYTNVILGYDKGLSHSTVLNLYQEPSSEELWIATDGGGVNRFTPTGEKFRHYPNTWGDKVVSISGFTANELLISIFSKGIFIFDKRTGQKRPLPLSTPSLEQNMRYSGQPVNLCQDTPHSVLLLSSLPYRYHIPTGNLEAVTCAGNVNIRGMLSPIAHDSTTTWLHDPYHIYRLDRNANRLEVYMEIPQGIYINTVSRDANGTFWIGSNHGLYTCLPDTRKLEQIPTSLFDCVDALICDNRKGIVWLGADQKLFAWLTASKRFILFGEADGASKNEYLSKPRLLSPAGNIYLGGVKGLLYIHPDLKPEKNAAAPDDIRLAAFSVNGENRMYQLEQNRISVPWNSKNIRIRVMTYGGDILRPKAYHFRINGSTVESYHPELVIPSLSPGTYPIRVSCNTQEGNRTSPQLLFTLIVSPPWYSTWWFTSLCILFVIGWMLWIFYILLRRKENRMKWMVKEHEQKAYEEKVRFLINISHELRTPLTLIYAPLSRILKTLNPADANYRPLKNIYKQARRMTDLINMVLNVRKMEVEETKLKLLSHPLNEWIRETGADFTDEASVQQVQIDYRLDESIGQVMFDKEMCTIIITNLLTNALKHSPANTTITLRSQREGEYVHISVTDQGEGIKEKDTEKVFVRFYQSDGEQGGSGIGLSYAKMLVELHKGTIGAANNAEGGATFYFNLPLTPPSGDEVTAEAASPPPETDIAELLRQSPDTPVTTPEEHDFPTGQHTLLLVDDNRNLTDFLFEELKSSFKTIYLAYDGTEALEIAKKEIPDIIVSDVMMPEMNGYDLCKTIKRDIAISHIPVILLTARTDEQSRQYGYKIGADAYLSKPFDMDKLIKIIQNRLYNREQIKEHYRHAGVFPQPVESTFSQADEAFLLKLDGIIRENITNPQMDIPFICLEIGMSKTSLYNKLKAITNMGANDYINKFRLEQAIVLIKTTDMPFTEIADHTGFTTLRYFSTAFKQYTGMTPTQYKKAHRSPSSEKL